MVWVKSLQSVKSSKYEKNLTWDNLNDVGPDNNPVPHTSNDVVGKTKLIQNLSDSRFSGVLDERDYTINNCQFERLVAEVLDVKVPVCGVRWHPCEANYVKKKEGYVEDVVLELGDGWLHLEKVYFFYIEMNGFICLKFGYKFKKEHFWVFYEAWK